MFTCAFAVCVHNSKKGKILLQGTVVILDILNGLQSGAKLPLKLFYNQPGDAGIILNVTSPSLTHCSGYGAMETKLLS